MVNYVVRYISDVSPYSCKRQHEACPEDMYNIEWLSNSESLMLSPGDSSLALRGLAELLF